MPAGIAGQCDGDFLPPERNDPEAKGASGRVIGREALADAQPLVASDRDSIGQPRMSTSWDVGAKWNGPEPLHQPSQHRLMAAEIPARPTRRAESPGTAPRAEGPVGGSESSSAHRAEVSRRDAKEGEEPELLPLLVPAIDAPSWGRHALLEDRAGAGARAGVEVDVATVGSRNGMGASCRETGDQYCPAG